MSVCSIISDAATDMGYRNAVWQPFDGYSSCHVEYISDSEVSFGLTLSGYATALATTAVYWRWHPNEASLRRMLRAVRNAWPHAELQESL